MQLHRHAEAVAYLLQRGLHQTEVIEELRIGYAPGRCLRAWLTSLGYPLESLQQAGLVNAEGMAGCAGACGARELRCVSTIETR